MPSIEDTIDDKIAEIREEFEEVIDGMKNDIDDIGHQIPMNRKQQDQAFDKMNTAMERLQRDLKQLGKQYISQIQIQNLTNPIY